MRTSLVWFKRDLRVLDHVPLAQAAERGRVIALYVYEDELITQPESSAAHFRFIADSLTELRALLAQRGVRLLIRRGAIPQVFDELLHVCAFDALFSHEETGNGVTYARDKRVTRWAAARGISWHEFPQTGVVRRLRSRDGWAARWTSRMREPRVDPPEQIDDAGHVLGLDPGRVFTPDELGFEDSDLNSWQRGGTSSAHSTLRSFLNTRGETYSSSMSSPRSASEACSRISPHLAYGTISMKTVYQATRTRRHQLTRETESVRRSTWIRSLSSFESRLYWHCHFMQKLEDEPAIEHERLCRAVPDPREAEPFDERLFDAWCKGETGFPLVDACMRMLQATGWLNFRMRAMLVSFAAYHLWLPWQRPALHLARCFLDFEPGIHYPQVQMQAGTTGVHTLRIYNPTKQAREQDPEGMFIRAWIPALRDVDNAYVHAPHTMPPLLQRATGFLIDRDYPSPVVDDVQAAARARDVMWAMRGDRAVQEVAPQILARHSSRKRSRRTKPAGRSG